MAKKTTTSFLIRCSEEEKKKAETDAANENRSLNKHVINLITKHKTV